MRVSPSLSQSAECERGVPAWGFLRQWAPAGLAARWSGASGTLEMGSCTAVEMEQLSLLLLLLPRLLPTLPPAPCPPLPSHPWPALPQRSFAELGTSSSISLVGLNNHPTVLLGALPSSSLPVVMHPDRTDTAVGPLRDPAPEHAAWIPSTLPGSQTRHLDPKHSTWIPSTLPGSQAHHV